MPFGVKFPISAAFPKKPWEKVLKPLRPKLRPDPAPTSTSAQLRSDTTRRNEHDMPPLPRPFWDDKLPA